MFAVAIRLGLGLALMFGGVLIVDVVLGTDVLGAIARLVIWFWLRLVDLLVRVTAKFSMPLARTLSVLGKKALIRGLSKPLWRLAIMFVALFIIGKARRDKAEQWLEDKRAIAKSTLQRTLDFKPDWPRGVRALIAAIVIVAFLALFVWISLEFGRWWGLGASIVLWMLVEKVHLIGLDALTSWMVEKWAPVKALIARHAWLRWLWLGPLFQWLAVKVETFSESHADKHEGKSTIEVWRENRRRRLQRLREARARMMSPQRGTPRTDPGAQSSKPSPEPDRAPTQPSDKSIPKSNAG